MLRNKRVDIGRDREKRDAALHDFAYIRSRQLPPGAPVSGTTAKEAHQEKTVRTKLGPVCGFGGRVGDLHQQGTKSALLSQRDPVLNEQSRPDQPKKGDTPPLPL